jgi:O-antigen ligase
MPRLNAVDLVLGLFCIWVGLNAAIKGSWLAAKPLIETMLLLFIVSKANFSEKRIKYLLLALLATGAVVAGLGGYEYLFEHKRWVTATLLNPNTFSGYLCLLLPMSFCLWKAEGPWPRFLGFLITTIMAFGMTVSFTRGGYIAVLVGMSGFAMMKDKRLFLVILAYMIAFGFIVSEARMRFSSLAAPSNAEQRGPVMDTRATRIYLWKFAWEEFKTSPLTGIGIGTFHSRLDKYLEVNPQAKERFPNTSGPHNFYMKILCELGLPGLVLFLAVLICWIGKCGKALFSANLSRVDPWAAGIFWGLMSFLLHNLTNSLFTIVPCVLGFWISLAILSRLAEGDACPQS